VTNCYDTMTQRSCGGNQQHRGRDAHGAVLKGLPVRENRAQESGSEITVERRRLVYVDRAKQKTSY